ncbi:protein transport protein Sec23A-like protein [Perkinsela sp. CCAP 1560/4]|nr:protein transport protein Sec23A-like protein [Perkinsela sp. CCAP 1560/4]|eukprot:KNH07467.1 protein transport protein Sec23A-like protein [Perkinsela sp. CCAP 1560/4]
MLTTALCPDDLLQWTWKIYPNRTTKDRRCESEDITSRLEHVSIQSRTIQFLRSVSRFTQNTLPVGGADPAMGVPPLVIPLACVYSPLVGLGTFEQSRAQLRGPPRRCTKCGAVFNQLNDLNHEATNDPVNRWICVFCRFVNTLPDSLPRGSLTESSTGVSEYILADTSEKCLMEIHVFVIDVSLPVSELNSLLQGMLSVLQLLPPDASICVITYAEMVCIWELLDDGIVRNISLRGDRNYENEDIVRYAGTTQCSCDSMLSSNFLVPLADADFVLTTILQEIAPSEGGGVGSAMKPKRCAGTALQVAVGLINCVTCRHVTSAHREICGNTYCTELHLFIGGKATKGATIDFPVHTPNRKQDSLLSKMSDVAAKSLRTNFDVPDSTRLFAKLSHFFQNTPCVVFNIFVCSLDIVGLEGIEQLVSSTGGAFFLHERFDSQLFQDVLYRHFGEHHDQLVFDVSHEIFTTPETHLTHCVGPIERTPPIKRLSPATFHSNGMHSQSTLTLFFDSVPVEAASAAYPSKGADDWDCHSSRIFQLMSRYTNRKGQHIMRVTTARRGIGPYLTDDARGLQFYVEAGGFDQKTAFVVTAKCMADAIRRYDIATLLDLSRALDARTAGKIARKSNAAVSCNEMFPVARVFLDAMLVAFFRLYSSMGRHEMGDFPKGFADFPCWCYHLLRCDLFQNFNTSIDEQLFRYSYLIRNNVETTFRIIVPELTRYSCDTAENLAGVQTPLDRRFLSSDSICILDAFFELVIQCGYTAHQWKEKKLHLDPAYRAFGDLVQVVANDTERKYRQSRLPPLLVHCIEDDSQSRFLSQFISEVVPPFERNAENHSEKNSLQVFLTTLREKTFGSKN